MPSVGSRVGGTEVGRRVGGTKVGRGADGVEVGVGVSRPQAVVVMVVMVANIIKKLRVWVGARVLFVRVCENLFMFIGCCMYV